MTKVNKPGSHKPEENKPNRSNASNIGAQSVVPKNNQPVVNKGKQGGKNRSTAIGGTAIPGAKSTQPKEIKGTNPQQQQAEVSNREMRRRMERLGTGPYSENPTMTAREKRLKRLEKRKQQRLEEVQKTVAKAPRPNTSLGRRNTYFLIAVVAILIALAVLFIVIRHPF